MELKARITREVWVGLIQPKNGFMRRMKILVRVSPSLKNPAMSSVRDSKEGEGSKVAGIWSWFVFFVVLKPRLLGRSSSLFKPDLVVFSRFLEGGLVVCLLPLSSLVFWVGFWLFGEGSFCCSASRVGAVCSDCSSPPDSTSGPEAPLPSSNQHNQLF